MRRRLVALAAVACVALSAAPGSAYRRPGTTERVGSGNNDVDQAVPEVRDFTGWYGYDPDISADGRYVAFVSRSATQVPGDANTAPDVFRWDRRTKRTELVSAALNGAPGVGICRELDNQQNPVYQGSYVPAISGDGRYVAFASCAGNLVAGDTNNGIDVFVRDLARGETTRVSVSSNGEQMPGQLHGESLTRVAISDDGRYVAFSSISDSLAPGGNGKSQVYVHERATGRTSRVSVGPGGVAGDGYSTAPALSADGRLVAFQTSAANVVPGVTGAHVVVRDLRTGRNEIADVGPDGRPGDGIIDGGTVGISGDGRHVAFSSTAPDLVPNDRPGFQAYDVFVRDRVARRTERVSVSSAGVPGDGNSLYSVDLSHDGRFVAFTGRSGNWFPTGSGPLDPLLGGTFHVYRYDRRTGTLDWLSRAPDGSAANAYSQGAAISADGRLVVFDSEAGNLVANDTNDRQDTFVRDVGPGLGAGAVSAITSGDTVTGASLVSRPDDYFVRLEVRRMPALVGLDLTAGGTRFRVLATRTVTGGSFVLLRRDGGTWTLVATLEGGYGTTGLSVVVAVPRDLLPSGPIDDLRAFTEAGVS